MLKAFQAHQIPLSVAECPDMRAWVESLNEKAAPACYESLVDIQQAQREAQTEETIAWFEQRREEGHKVGGQFDMWKKHGMEFVAFNFTHLELTEEDTVGGIKPKWEVRTALLDFAVFDVSHTAENIKDFLNRTLAKFGLTWDDFNLLAGDGASNNVATFRLLAEDSPAPDTAICFCHDLARAVLFVLGLGAALRAEDRLLMDKVTATMKKMRTLAVKLNNVGKLKAALHRAQEADGVERELDTIKSAITRWNGHYLGLMRNITLKHHIVAVLEEKTSINVMTYDEDGEVVMKVQACADITPTALEWTIAAESHVVLEPAYKATQVLQGVKTCPPNKAFFVVYNLYSWCVNAAATSTFRIPVPALTGTTDVGFIRRKYVDLRPETKRMITLLGSQLYDRFICNGPNKTHFLCMQIDKSIKWPPSWLTGGQVAVAQGLLKVACAKAAGDAPVAAQEPPEAEEEEAAEKDESVCDIMACESLDKTTFSSAGMLESDEDGLWANMSSEDYEIGVVQCYGGTATKKTLQPPAFDPMFFWANPGMLKKYPCRARVFKGSYSGVGAEATSESTFSVAGRAYTKSRTDIAPEQLCNSVVCLSGEKRRPTDATDVQASYKKMEAPCGGGSRVWP